MEGKDEPFHAQVEDVQPQRIEEAQPSNFDFDEGEASKVSLKVIVIMTVSSVAL